MTSFSRILRSKKGQSLIELSFIAPLMLALAYGAVEVGSVISTYLTLTHTTREGANLASRGGSLPIDINGANYSSPDDVLDTIIKAAAPTLTAANQAQWRVVYSKVRRDGTPCLAEPCNYIVETGPGGQITRGTLNKQSKLGTPSGSPIPPSVLPGIQNVKDNQIFHVIEVFYNYAPNIITYVGKGINTDLYDRTIFTNISGT
ncbi:MAG: TadE/TadG family type IV pilus assembly protein [Candidatus Binatia bacterium]